MDIRPEQAAALSALLTGATLKLLDFVLKRQAAQGSRGVQSAHERLTSVQELSAVIDTLHKQVEWQAEQIADLRQRNEQLETRVEKLVGFVQSIPGAVARVCPQAREGKGCPLVWSLPRELVEGE